MFDKLFSSYPACMALAAWLGMCLGGLAACLIVWGNTFATADQLFAMAFVFGLLFVGIGLVVGLVGGAVVCAVYRSVK